MSYQWWTGLIPGLLIPGLLILNLWLLRRRVQVHAAIRKAAAPSRTVNWLKIAALEQELYGEVFHHGFGVTCRCHQCLQVAGPVDPDRFKAHFGTTSTVHVGSDPVREAAAERLMPSGMHALRAARQNHLNHLKAVVDQADSECRTFNPGEQSAWDQLMHEIDLIDQRITTIASKEKRDYERGRAQGEDIIRRSERITDPALLSRPVEVTALGDRTPWYIEGDPDA